MTKKIKSVTEEVKVVPDHEKFISKFKKRMSLARYIDTRKMDYRFVIDESPKKEQEESQINTRRMSVYSKSSLLSSSKIINMFSQQSIENNSNNMSKTSKNFNNYKFRNRSLPVNIKNFKGK